MKRILAIFAICMTPALAQTPKPAPLPQWMPVEQIGTEAHTFQNGNKTETVTLPVHGCRAGYVLWNGTPYAAYVNGGRVYKIYWHEAVEQTLHYKHPKYALICGLKGLTPPEDN